MMAGQEKSFRTSIKHSSVTATEDATDGVVNSATEIDED